MKQFKDMKLSKHSMLRSLQKKSKAEKEFFNMKHRANELKQSHSQARKYLAKLQMINSRI
jgi:hypothetical protein